MIVGVPTVATGAKHCTVLLLPAQFHDHGPAPLAAEAAPKAQRFMVGALFAGIPTDAPQAPSVTAAPVTVTTPLVASSV
jgi:hypothetical protein